MVVIEEEETGFKTMKVIATWISITSEDDNKQE